LFSTFFLHFIYAWTEKSVFFGTLVNQTLDITSPVYYYTRDIATSLNYTGGILFGGLFFDFFFRRVALKIIEFFLLRFRCPSSEWKHIVHTGTRRFIVALSLRRVPLYSSDYLLLSSFGFFGRDTELRRCLTRTTFSLPRNATPPIMFEGRNVIGGDRYNRPTDDVLRDPRIGRLAVEARHDLVDETYRTQQINQRVDNVYLGAIERKIFDWLAVRAPKNLASSNKKTMDQEGGPSAKNREPEEKAAVLVKGPARRILGSDVMLPGYRTNNSYYILDRGKRRSKVEYLWKRFNNWFRVTRRRAVENRDFELASDIRKMPDNLRAIFYSYFYHQSYLASVGMLEPQKVVRYSSPVEFARKRNARRSPLYRAPIRRYIDLLLKLQFQTGKSDISSRQQQYNIHYARLILHDYVNVIRRYSDIPSMTESAPQLSDSMHWQRELHFHIFGGNRRRSNSVYNQQYVGNLQIIRRLFAISWSSQENFVPVDFQDSTKIFLRRKISMDQRTFETEKSVFERTEIEKVFFVDNKDFNRILSSPNEFESSSHSNFRLKKYYLLNPRVSSAPLYAGWDSRRHALVLCNRFLPIEWRVRTRLADNIKAKTPAEYPVFLSNLKRYEVEKLRRDFAVWPKNLQVRRIRLRNARYTSRAILHRRVLSYKKGLKYELSFLSQDQRIWWRKAIRWGWGDTYHELLNSHGDVRQGEKGTSRFPLSLERRIRENYIPGDFQSSIRGGFLWPGSSTFLFVPKSYYHS
jgi:hypothetical protein